MMPSPVDYRQLDTWCGRLRDEQISVDEFAQLEALLSGNPEARQYFVAYMTAVALLECDGVDLHADLESTGTIPGLDPQAEDVTPSVALENLFETAERSRRTRKQVKVYRRRAAGLAADETEPAGPRRLRLAYAWVSVAAAVALAVAGWAAFIWPTEPTPQVVEQQPPAEPEPVEVTLATFTKSADGAFSGDARSLRVGDALMSRTLRLTHGTVQLEFASGARVILQSPAELELQTPLRVRLVQGKLSAKVPTSAVGFSVVTPQVQVVDLGTEFAVHVDDFGATQVAVFSGRVEVRPLDGAPASPGSGAVETLVTGAFKAYAGGDAAGIELPTTQARRFVRELPMTHGVVATEGAVHWLDGLPNSVAPGRLESDARMHLFLETDAVKPRRPVAVNVKQPGTYRTFNKVRGQVQPGVAVRSYWLHFDPLGSTPERQVELQGAVTFDGDIVGVIATTPEMTKSNAHFARPATRHVRMPFPLEQTHDVVTLSPDRRTLRVGFHATSGVDAVRILVREPAPKPRPTR